MRELNWVIFRTKFSGKEQEAFESLAYELFCQEHGQPFGIHAYQNQTGIEADPIKIDEEYLGFQAKFLDVKPSDRKSKLIEAFQSAKKKNPELTQIYFYLNKSFTESPLPNQKKSQVQTLIEDEAKKLEIKLVWKVPSQFKIQLSQPKNQRIYHRYFTNLNLPSSQEILEKFESSSFHLKNVISYFEGLEDSHIPRKETSQLLDWINSPLGEDEKGIMLLVGNAGYGKSVIIKDLYKELYSKKIPVLGIKADKYYTRNKKELQQQLDFDAPIEILVETLTTTYEQVVVLVDQIDALSQSLSAKREYLDSFQTLVNSLTHISGVRIIISVRTYDLHYDSDLRYYNNQKHVKVSLLETNEVAKVLDQKGIDQQQVSDKLLELIRIPHHLNVLCKVSEGNRSLYGIQTLHDLYNELWYQKIAQYSNAQSCKETMYEIASQMYADQSINLSKFKIEEKYFAAIEYLKSNALLVEAHNEIQFFHQTFFDYCFAKQFVESGESIEKHILKNHQGLFVRAGLKMIMSFLRDYDLKAYIKSLEKIVTSSKFRFHIKVLLVTELGYREEPNGLEKDFVNRKILSSDIWKDIFIEAINTSHWLGFLDQTGELRKLVASDSSRSNKIRSISRLVFKNPRERTHEDRLNQIYHLFRRLLPVNRHQVLQIIQDFPDFTDKPRFVYGLLYFIKTWDNLIAIQLFEEYSEVETPKDTHGFYKILKDAAKDNLAWVLKIYRKHLKAKIKARGNSYNKPDLKHDDSELFKKLFDLNLEQTFDFTLDFVKSVTQSVLNDKESNSKLYSDSRLYFFAYGSSTHNYFERVFQLLINKARKLSIENPIKYEVFVEDHLCNNSISILLIVVISLQELPDKYTDLIFEFLKVFSDKGGFEMSSKAGYYVRELINLSYTHFNDNQREKINDLILKIDPEIERTIRGDQHGKKHHVLRWYGKTKYEYLCAIPHDLLFEQPLLKKVYQELKRKFGEFKEEKPYNSIARPVLPPLPTSAYENMNFEEWQNSFLHYDVDRYHAFDPFKGSKTEHSRAFKKQVTDRPSEFAVFVEKLIDENIVDQSYILSGLDGLKDGKHDPDDFKRLFKKALQLDLDREHTMYFVWLTDYLIDSKNCDDEVITFLCDIAINHEDPSSDEKVDDSIEHGINTVRGAAANRIPYLQSYPNHVELIFDTIEQVLDDFSVSVRATVIPRLFYLMNLDKQRTLRLLLKVVELNEIELLKQTPRTVQYLADDFFKELEFYFKKALNHKEMHGDCAVILAVLWINNQKECHKLLNKFLKRNEDARSRMIDVATHYLFHDDYNTRRKARKLFLKFLKSKDEKVIQEYSTTFLHIKDKEEDVFLEFYPLLEKYSKSNVVKSSPHYYYEYLLSNVKIYPKECIDLVSRFRCYDKPDISESSYYDNDPVKILLGAYNSLRSVNGSDDKYKEKCMKIFDQLLMDNRFRLSANDVTLHADL